MNSPSVSDSAENIKFFDGPVAKTIGYYLAFIALGFSSAVIGPTIKGLSAHTQTTISQISIIFTIKSIGYLVGVLYGGRVYDRKKGHPVIALVLLGIAVVLCLVPVVSQLWLLAIILLAAGACEGMADVGCNTLLVWVHGSKVGPYMNALHFFFGVGSFIAPLIVAQSLAATNDITWAYWILGLIIFPMFLGMFRLPSPAVETSSRPGSTKGDNLLVAVLIALFFFLYVGGESCFGGWIFSYAVGMNLVSQTSAAYLTSAFWGALTFGRLLGVPISSRFSPRSILWVDIIGTIVSLMPIVLFPKSAVAVWIGALGTGLFMASVFPTIMALAERNMKISARTTSIFFIGSSTGGMILPWAVGQLYELLGPAWVMIAILISVLLSLLVYIFLMVSIRKITSKHLAS
jgi:FHS family Na+ dependent glucose MFS transporter 1